MTAPVEQPAITDAVSLLIDAADTITERGKQRDTPRGERSMGRAVKAFNAMYGTSLTEPMGWQFMSILKMARASAGGPVRIDDYIDQAGYAALAGECAARRSLAQSIVAVPGVGGLDALLAGLNQQGRHQP